MFAEKLFQRVFIGLLLGSLSVLGVSLAIAESSANNAPAFGSSQGDLTLDVGDSFNYSVVASDPDNDPITFSINSDLSSWLNFESNPVQSAFAGTGITPITNGGVYDSPDGTAATEANLSIMAYGLSAVDGKVFFGDQEEYGIRYVDANGAIRTLIAGDGDFATLQAAGIVHDLSTNTTYFGNYAVGKVYKSVNGEAKQEIASGLCCFILGMALDKANNNLYVSARNAIYEIDLTNNAVRKIIGSGASQGSYSDTGVASTSEVNQPHGLTFDNDGRLVFADRFNDIIRRIDIANNTVETIAGIQGTGIIGGNGGAATAATFADPTGVAIDGRRRIFITERLASVVRMIDVDGNIDEFASVTGVGFLDSLAINEDGELLIGGSRKIVQVNTSAKVFGITGCDTIGDHHVTITVADVGGLSATQSFLITVADSTQQCRVGAPVLIAIEEGDGALVVAFDPPSDIGGGTVSNYEYQLNGGDWVAFDPAITSSPATITGLANGTDYSVKLRAVTEGGGGEASNAKTGNPFAAPSAPQNVVVISRPGGFQVVWDFSINGGGRAITAYRVLINGEVACEVAASEDSMACDIEGLSAGEDYVVEVLAVTDSAITPSAQDNQVQATPTAIIPVPTLSVWALLVLMLSLMGLSLSRLRRLN